MRSPGWFCHFEPGEPLGKDQLVMKIFAARSPDQLFAKEFLQSAGSSICCFARCPQKALQPTRAPTLRGRIHTVLSLNTRSEVKILAPLKNQIVLRGIREIVVTLKMFLRHSKKGIFDLALLTDFRMVWRPGMTSEELLSASLNKFGTTIVIFSDELTVYIDWTCNSTVS